MKYYAKCVIFNEDLYTTKAIDNIDIDSYYSLLENSICLSNEDKSISDSFPTLEECEIAVK